MRFRKSIKICKGVKLNLSKSGVSTTIGGRGLSFNLGSKGGYVNTSIPGTGLYDRHKITGNKKSHNTKSYSRNNNSSITKFNLSINEDSGEIIVIDENNIEITDDAILKKLRRSDAYKEAKEKLYERLKDKIDNNDADFIDIYKLTQKIFTEDQVINKLNNLIKEEYIIEPYVKEELSEEELYKLNKELYKQAKKLSKGKTSFFPIWTFFKRRKEFINNQVNELKILREEEEANKEKLYYEEENAKKEIADKEFENAFNNHKLYLNNILSGNEDFVNEMLEKVLNDIELTIEFKVDFEYRFEEKLIYLDLDLPEIEDIPNKKADYLSSGKLKVKDKSQKELKEDYLKCVCGLAFFFSSLFFNVSTKIENILVSAYTQRINKKTGNIEDNYIYSILLERNKMNDINFKNADTILAFDNFRNKKDFTKSFEAKTIIPASSLKDI